MIQLDVKTEIIPDKITEFILTVDHIITELSNKREYKKVKATVICEDDNLFSLKFLVDEETDFQKLCLSEEYTALTGSLKILSKSYLIELTNNNNNHRVLLNKGEKH